VLAGALKGESAISRSVHPTIYDVAARAGVSIATVSKTLNTPTRVAPSTRERVLDAVHELDYVPKEVATTRARRGTGRVGVFAPFSAHPSFGDRLNGVLGVMSGPRHEVVVFDVRSAEESADVLESLPALRSLDGLILMSVPFGKRVASAMRRGRLPVVLVDLVRSDFPTVLVDDLQGGALAAVTLREAGKSRLAYVGHRQLIDDFDSPSRRRQAGFEEEITRGGLGILPPVMTLLVSNDFTEASAAAEELLRADGRPDGVFAHTDELAAAVWAAADRVGLRVPEDLAIVGFDDGVIAQALGLTTIRQPLRETGQWAAQSMREMIADPGLVVPSLTLSVSLIRRRSA
jgi:LacI family transcriptional regulator